MKTGILKIESYCKIASGRITLNGSLFFESDSQSGEFVKDAFRELGAHYPKFFKMDNLSRLAFLGTEILLRNHTDKENTALLFANRSSSLDTDVKYQKSISDKSDYFPSPAVFVYTLPNICLGEISIRHQLKTENSFFIFDRFNSAFMADYATILIETGKAERVLCGWVELFEDHCDALFYMASKNGILPHTKEQIEILYNS